MSRSCRLLVCLSIFISCLRVCASADRATEIPPNVVLILADDLGWADLACYGADLHETPNIDRLAQQGIRFTDAYAASICSPTRASLMTGKHYARMQMTIWREATQKPPRDRKLIPPSCVSDLGYDELTLAEVLKKGGYQTSIVGKWHLGDANYYPETQGFDTNIGGTHWGAPQTFFFPYKGQGRFAGEFRYVPHLEGGKPGEYLTDRLTDEALKVIDQVGDRPFFLYFAHHAPHTPIEAKEDLVRHYEQKLKPDLNHQNAKYAAMVHSLDESVGRVMQKLEERGVADRTIVIFVSDNGGHIGDYDSRRVTNNTPLRSGKGSLYEGGVRVPLIMKVPGLGRGQICHEPVFVADLFPTLAELAGQTVDRSANTDSDGRSIVSLLKSVESHLDRDALYFHYPHYYPTTSPVSAIRQGEWKLLEYFEDHRVELFNLKNDLSESNDLATTMPDRAALLRTRLENWRQSIHAQLPTENPNYKPK